VEESELNAQVTHAKSIELLNEEDSSEVTTRPNDAGTDSGNFLSQTDEQASPTAKTNESTKLSPLEKQETSPSSTVSISISKLSYLFHKLYY